MPTVNAENTKREIRHMFALWDVGDFSIIREQEEYKNGSIKRGDGVTIQYVRKGTVQTVFCNHFDYARNLRSIFLFLNRVRIGEKEGISYQGLSSTKDLVVNRTSEHSRGEKEEKLEDACDVLGVDPGASLEEIERVYKVKVQFVHPDKGGSQEKFTRLQAAYELIKGAIS